MSFYSQLPEDVLRLFFDEIIHNLANGIDTDRMTEELYMILDVAADRRILLAHGVVSEG